MSFVVLAWRSAETIATCLRSLLAQKADSSFEVVCWINGSPEDQAVVETVPGVRVLVSPVNLGFAGALDAALPQLLGRDIALVNADSILSPDWLARTTALLHAGVGPGRTGAAGGVLYGWPPGDLNGPAQLGVNVDGRTGWTSIDYLAAGESDPRPMESLSGAAVLISGEAIREVGWFEPAYFAYYEETDLFSRFLDHGWALSADPLAVGWHRTAASLGAGSWRYLWLIHRNRLRFVVRTFPPRRLVTVVMRELPAAIDYLLHGRVPSRVRLARLAAALWLFPHLPWLLVSRRDCQRVSSGDHDQIDVVITTYNQASMAPTALASALRQRIRPASITVIDDGSIDNTSAVLSTFSDAGVRTITQVNAGVAAARRAGAAQGSAPWIVFLDADDWLAPDYLSRTLAATDQRTGLVTTGWTWEGNRRGVRRMKRPSLAGVAVGNRVHSASLIRRCAYQQVGGHTSEMAGGYEDWDLALSILGAGWRGRRVDAPLLHYRSGEPGRNALAAKKESELRTRLRARHPEVYDGKGLRSLLIRTRVQLARWRGVNARVRATFASLRPAGSAATDQCAR